MQDEIKMYEKMHDNAKKFSGYSAKLYVNDIKALVEKHEPESMLDYGCGKGYQYLEKRIHDNWGGLLPHCYDPGVRQISEKPDRKFDGVICTDVLEHIPEENVQDVIKELFDYADKFVFMAIATFESKKLLPDGRNCHLTVKSHEWWDNIISEVATCDYCTIFRDK